MTDPQVSEQTTTSGGLLSGAATAALAEPGPSPLVVHAQALQSALADISTVTIQQLSVLLDRYGKDPDLPAIVLQLLPNIVQPNARAAAAVTAQWYEELNPASDYVAKPIEGIPDQRIEQTARWALYAPTEKTRVPEDLAPHELDVPATAPPEVTLSRLAGSSKRMVYDASRDTVVMNAAQEKVRWVRYAQPDACAFCRMLATRPPVYLSKESAETVVGRGVVATPRGSRALGQKYHDHCRCVGIPIRESHTWMPPKYVQQWLADYDQARSDVYDSDDPMTTANILSRMRANTDAK